MSPPKKAPYINISMVTHTFIKYGTRNDNSYRTAEGNAHSGKKITGKSPDH